MLLLNINRKVYMGSPKTLLHLNLSDLERSKSEPLRFQTLISCKGAELGHMLLSKKSAENGHLSYQLQVSSRAPRSMDLFVLNKNSSKIHSQRPYTMKAPCIVLVF